MKTRTFIAWVFFLIWVSAVPLTAQQYSDHDLIQNGNDAYARQQCVTAAKFIFAYILRNPAPVRNDPNYRARLENAITWCENNTAIYADSKGDAPGSTTVQPPPKPPIGPVPPAQPTPHHVMSVGIPAVLHATEQQKRCDIYARMAVAQSAANTANRCGYSGNRWTSNYNAHYQWCMQVAPASVFSETQARVDLLKQCAP